jgi:hypothetical protein
MSQMNRPTPVAGLVPAHTTFPPLSRARQEAIRAYTEALAATRPADRDLARFAAGLPTTPTPELE